MDDAAPRLIGLLLAGGVALLALRSQIGGTEQGERLFRIVLIAFVIVVLGAAWMLVRGEGQRALPPLDPDNASVA